jgi:hypothetical protein
MIVIRPNQMAAFRGNARRADFDYLMDYFENLYPELCVRDSSPQLRVRLERLAAHANAHGISGQRSVLIFVWLSLTLGEGFERQPGYSWMQPLLKSTRLPQQTKIDWLVRGLDSGLPTGVK